MITQNIPVEERLENFASVNGAHADYINDFTNDVRFDITLSVSNDVVTSKEDGGPKIDFTVKTYRSDDQTALRELFTTRNTSPNVWDGTRCEKNYVGSAGVGLDFDGDVTLESVRRQLAPFNYILHTSTSHMVAKDGLTKPRFRLYLPYAPGALRYTSQIECKKVYFTLLETIPGIDAAAVGPQQQFFPFTGKDASKFELYVNETGRYFDVDISRVPDDVFGSIREQDWDGTLRPKEELDRIVRYCPFARWMTENIDNSSVRIREPLKFALISNLCWFQGGRELIHEILRRDARPSKYDRDLVDSKIDWVLDNAGPHRYVTIAQKEPANALLWGWESEDNWRGPLAPAGWAKIGRIQNRMPLFTDPKNPDIYLKQDDSIIVDTDGEKFVQKFGTLKEKVKEEGCTVKAVCPFCDEEGASIRANMCHFVYLYCDHCKCSFWEHPDSPGLFTYNGDLLRVEMKSNRFISHEKLKPVNFRNGLEWDFACRVVMNDPKRRFIGDSFTINRIGSADFDCLGYDLNADDNSVVFKFPAIAVEVQDNNLIDRFLDGLFREHTDLFKNWMALNAYTNYFVLLVI